jgi:hypothetical protein
MLQERSLLQTNQKQKKQNKRYQRAYHHILKNCQTTKNLPEDKKEFLNYGKNIAMMTILKNILIILVQNKLIL